LYKINEPTPGLARIAKVKIITPTAPTH